tara:strand:+ start:184 stop:771 length:588 start_codon:yes stop_codon:yes gene_type:complete
MYKVEWEKSYSSNSFENKNEYPSEEVISFIMGNYGSVEDRSKINVLEVGCGWGNNLNFFKHKGFSYTGIDFSSTAVEHCLINHKNVFCCSMHDMPFPSNTFDVVVDRMAIQHNPMEIIKETFEEVRRVLKKSGSLFSILIDECSTNKYSFKTTYLNQNKIKEFTKAYSDISLDYQIRSTNSGKNFSRVNILTAQK